MSEFVVAGIWSANVTLKLVHMWVFPHRRTIFDALWLAGCVAMTVFFFGMGISEAISQAGH